MEIFLEQTCEIINCSAVIAYIVRTPACSGMGLRDYILWYGTPTIPVLEENRQLGGWHFGPLASSGWGHEACFPAIRF